MKILIKTIINKLIFLEILLMISLLLLLKLLFDQLNRLDQRLELLFDLLKNLSIFKKEKENIYLIFAQYHLEENIHFSNLNHLLFHLKSISQLFLIKFELIQDIVFFLLLNTICLSSTNL
jgi:hypothetical protein